MCSISGFIITDTAANRSKVAAFYQTILAAGAERGKDSTGVITLDSQGVMRRSSCIAPQHYGFFHDAVTTDCTVLIANNRAEPTTEFVADKTLADVPPFSYENIHVAHNGTIANDNQLRQDYALDTVTKIDSAVCPGVVQKSGIDKALDVIQGSFAFAIMDAEQPQKLWLARNYKPLYIQIRPDLGAIFFSSQATHLAQDNTIQSRLNQPAVISLPAYSMVEIDGVSGNITEHAFTPRTRNKKALIICSGGLDSTTAAKWAQAEGYEITLIHFLYGCRAEKKEVEAVQKIAQALDCECRFEDLSWLKRLGGSSLTDDSLEVTKNETGAEFAHEWVPARNLIMTALSAGLCDRYDYDTLVLGLNLEEGGAYPDNTVEFYQSLDHVLDIGTTSRPRLLSPLANMVKHEIVRLALDLDAPIHLAWSCYHNNEHHCGECGPCYMRQNAFKIIGETDTLIYENNQSI